MSLKYLNPALYRPQFEHSACGIGFIARTTGQPGHDIVELALEAVKKMEHRSGIDADGLSGDGAGISTHIPHKLLAAEIDDLPQPGDYALGMFFLPLEETDTAARIIENILEKTLESPKVSRDKESLNQNADHQPQASAQIGKPLQNPSI